MKYMGRVGNSNIEPVEFHLCKGTLILGKVPIKEPYYWAKIKRTPSVSKQADRERG